MEGSEIADWVDESAGSKPLLFALSLIAGSVDVIGFLGLGGLFIAHITGNLVVLAARLVGDGKAPVAHLIAVPVFVLVVALVKLLVIGLQRMRIPSLQPLLLLQFALLSAFLVTCIDNGPHADPESANMIVAGMLGVAAMAVQNALVQLLKGAPSTAVMTTNITRFVADLSDALLESSIGDRINARKRARRAGLVIAGFFTGCALGAACEQAAGLWSLLLPAGGALIAVALRTQANRDLSLKRTL
ncbi:YoaK family protein [Mesorhizobium sp. SARCC-RB16n]|uniref:YoaK family protein n=1 Tax=Mesorhizobium sp. SARCC-RB16n TaxID=2116687 RepID=UPI00166E7496|nr:DUF1275 family protein [Mesorhizobium sp. SARCC-RB16n]